MQDVVSALCCPHCSDGLERADGTLRCPAGHTFDIARQGYVNLLAGAAPAPAADAADMVRARAEFLAAGHYAALDELLVEVVTPLEVGDGLVVDAGSGTGHHLAVVLEALPAAAGLALDASKFAARRAARSHPRTTAVVWDTWRPWPVRDGAASLILNVFAPRNGAAFHRALRPDGALVVVTPAAGHLADLRPALGLLSVDAAKEERLGRGLGPYFALDPPLRCTVRLELGVGDVERLVRMGPSAYHLDGPELDRRLTELSVPVTATADFAVTVCRPRGQSLAGQAPRPAVS